MPLSLHPPKILWVIHILEQIHDIVPFVRKLTFKKCQVYFESPCRILLPLERKVFGDLLKLLWVDENEIKSRIKAMPRL